MNRPPDNNGSTRREFLHTAAGSAWGLAATGPAGPVLAAEAKRESRTVPSTLEPFRHIVARATDKHPRHTEGDMVRLKDGRWLMAYTQFNARSDEGRAAIVSRTSRDGGRTWTTPVVMQKNVGKKNVMSVSLLRLKSGKIAFAYLIKNSRDDCAPYMRISTDETLTWSDPVRVTPEPGYHVLNNARIVQLSTGRLVAPAAFITNLWTPRDHNSSWCYLSDDDGRTWRRGKGNVDLPKRGAMEPGVIEKANGDVWMILRTQLGRVYASTSADGCETFSKAKPTPLVAPESPATISRIPGTGDWLIVFNHNYEPGKGHCGRRTPLTTAISKDEGKTWRHYRNLEPDAKKAYAYTSIRHDDTNVHLTYYESSPKGPSHKHAIVPVKWLYR